MHYDLIIIGGGPAGITAGIYAARKKMKTLLICKDFFGQVGKTSEVDNYLGFPSINGMDLAKKFEQHLKKFKDIKILEGEEVTKIENLHRSDLLRLLVRGKTGQKFEKKEFLAKTIIVATGSDPRPLEIPGEKELIGRGLSYCSTCDAPFFKDKQVAIIGGGNAGFEAALDLAKYAKKVFIFERTNKPFADELLQERVKENKKIEVFLNKELKKIEGTKNVQAIVYQDLESHKTFQMPMTGVFVEIGAIPATGFLKGLRVLNKKDEIKANFKTGATSCKGLFAAGDVNDGKWKQIIIAAGEGARAALAAYEYLQKT